MTETRDIDMQAIKRMHFAIDEATQPVIEPHKIIEFYLALRLHTAVTRRALLDMKVDANALAKLDADWDRMYSERLKEI